MHEARMRIAKSRAAWIRAGERQRDWHAPHTIPGRAPVDRHRDDRTRLLSSSRSRRAPVWPSDRSTGMTEADGRLDRAVGSVDRRGEALGHRVDVALRQAVAVAQGLADCGDEIVATRLFLKRRCPESSPSAASMRGCSLLPVPFRFNLKRHANCLVGNAGFAGIRPLVHPVAGVGLAGIRWGDFPASPSRFRNRRPHPIAAFTAGVLGIGLYRAVPKSGLHQLSPASFPPELEHCRTAEVSCRRTECVSRCSLPQAA
jgi:hypothetical protein